ncbi:MAG: ROK family protein [Propionibacteriaceae bacterium]|jgi:predicted NBD/HSP70 family sugar kinase|nr:ROK family protein [Propionibacteriaceae bacterium]
MMTDLLPASPTRTRRPRPSAATTITRAGQKSLRQNNLCLVLAQIATADHDLPPSRADLADRSGLTKATVSSLVNDLIEADLVTELTPSAPRGAGRPATPLALAAGTTVGLGLEINVDFLGLRAVDLTGAIIDESFEQIDVRRQGPDVAFDRLVNLAVPMLARLADRSIRVIGACLALPGIADHPAGPLRLAPNLGWHDIDVRHLMARAYERLIATDPRAGSGGLESPFSSPCASSEANQATQTIQTWLVERLVIDNEANLAARTEIGRHRDTSFIYVSGEVGIGAAIVVDGQVFSGLHGWAGEIGHIMVDPHGPVCACGAKGCLEMYAGKRALMLAAGLDGNDDIHALTSALASGSPAARAALAQAAQALGIALANCVNLVDVSRIVLGGSFAALTPALSPSLGQHIASRVLSSRWVGADLDIRASRSGSYAATTGAALAVLDHAMADPQSALWSTIA